MKTESENKLNTTSIYQEISREYMPSVLKQNDEALPEIEERLRSEKTFTREIGELVAANNVRFLKIPKNVKEIEAGALSWCRNLNRIEIPSSVKKIGDEAFYACSALEQVIIGNGVNEIGNDAFTSCSSLKSIRIPSSVKSIGAHAFFNTPLSFIEFPGKKLDKVEKLENYPWGIKNFEGKFNSVEQNEEEKELTSYLNPKKLKPLDTYDNEAQTFEVTDK